MQICITEYKLTYVVRCRSTNKSYQPQRGGVLINGENYWPVKLKHRCTSHTKCVNLHSDDPSVQSIVKETMKNTTEPKINYCPN